MDQEDLSTYNIIATFPDEDVARDAVHRLHDAGVDSKSISYLGARAVERAQDLDAPEEGDSAPPDTEEVHTEVPKRAGATAAAGAGAGGAAGFLAGLIAVGIPGAGPLIGAGVWAATAGGATAGAVAGGMTGGITKMWELHYKDAVGSGGALVGVHSEDQREVHQASKILLKQRPQRLDHLDKDGNLLHE
jgi:hypothetical protein